MWKREGIPWVWIAGTSGLVGALLIVLELPFIDWRGAVPPVDVQPLVIRQDAKGDGRFLAPRSGRRQHRGVDLAAPLQSPVRAIRSGRVARVGEHRGLGRFVEVSHRGNLRSLYAHLHEVHVGQGERVRQGAILGTVGKTGNARHRWITPHVHLEVLADGRPIDPSLVGVPVGPAVADVVQWPMSSEELDADGGE